MNEGMRFKKIKIRKQLEKFLINEFGYEMYMLHLACTVYGRHVRCSLPDRQFSAVVWSPLLPVRQNAISRKNTNKPSTHSNRPHTCLNYGELFSSCWGSATLNSRPEIIEA